ncbi:MAG: hypothetical protein ACOYEI_03820 [Acetivibrionales bacterium]|jgi:hypothetical protein
MREIDKNAVKAQKDKTYLEEFISKNEPFIMNTAHKTLGCLAV